MAEVNPNPLAYALALYTGRVHARVQLQKFTQPNFVAVGGSKCNSL